MQVTITTPVLNGARFLEATLDSIQSQSYQDWRHVIVDGGSTDETLEILQRRAELDSRITLINCPGSSLYEAMMVGFDTAPENSLLGWLNCDDLYTPWAMSAAVRLMAAPAGPVWISGLPALWDRYGALQALQATAWRPRGAIRRGWFHDGFLGCLQQETMFFRKSLISGLTETERREILSQKLAGDFALWRAFARQAPLVIVPLLLGGFRVHDENRSIRQSELYASEVRALGGGAPPVWLAQRLRTLFEMLSSAANVRAFRKAAHELHRAAP